MKSAGVFTKLFCLMLFSLIAQPAFAQPSLVCDPNDSAYFLNSTTHTVTVDLLDGMNSIRVSNGSTYILNDRRVQLGVNISGASCYPIYSYRIKPENTTEDWIVLPKDSGGTWETQQNTVGIEAGELPPAVYDVEILVRGAYGASNWYPSNTAIFNFKIDNRNVPRCDPNVDFIDKTIFDADLYDPTTGLLIYSIGPCISHYCKTIMQGQQVVVEAMTGGTGCDPIYSFQVRRLPANNPAGSVDSMWYQLTPTTPDNLESGTFTRDNAVYWDTSVFDPGYYTLRVFARNRQGIGSNVENSAGGVFPITPPSMGTSQAIIELR
ncbi:MAG: hypothetical protein HZA20_14540 [Nitrospirae bacterium]|nr:hypothetical protein [Nitrospirota bacterium]